MTKVKYFGFIPLCRFWRPVFVHEERGLISRTPIATRAYVMACSDIVHIFNVNVSSFKGALWHIYAAEDADKIRECLREVS